MESQIKQNLRYLLWLVILATAAILFLYKDILIALKAELVLVKPTNGLQEEQEKPEGSLYLTASLLSETALGSYILNTNPIYRCLTGSDIHLDQRHQLQPLLQLLVRLLQ